MVNVRLASGLLCVLLSVPAFASSSFLCVVEIATGFTFDKHRKQWRSTNFKADEKYLVSKPPEPIPAFGPYVWQVTRIGGDIS